MDGFIYIFRLFVRMFKRRLKKNMEACLNFLFFNSLFLILMLLYCLVFMCYGLRIGGKINVYGREMLIFKF